MSSSEEEEELLLHVEFNGMLEKDVLERSPVFFKMIGVEGQRPVMQIGNQTFAGEYQDVLGTALFFDEDPNPPGCDPVFTKTPEHQLRYVCKTRKVLQMSRVFLKKKQPTEESGSRDDESDVETTCEKDEDIHQRELSYDDLTMEVDEDPVLLERKKKTNKTSSDFNVLLEATTSGETSKEVEKIVEEQVRNVTEAAENLPSDQDTETGVENTS